MLTDRPPLAPADGSPALDVSPDIRVLRRVAVVEGRTGVGGPAVGSCAVVDVETTGLAAEDPIIELAIRPFRYDADGIVTAIGALRVWREDPGRPIPPEITDLTGLTDEDVAGCRIDDGAASELLRSATFVCAHNAAFDRPRIERRLPGVRGLAWACSMSDVRWRREGVEGARLGDLLAQVGWFHDGHRAGDDVDGVVALLRHRFGDGATALSRMIDGAMAPSWVVTACGSPYSANTALRSRCYRWSPDRRAWWREVRDDERDAEASFLASEVYGGRGGSPDYAARDWTVRHG